MPYYCNYNGTGYLTAPTLGNLHSGSPKIRINIKKFKQFGSSVEPIFWQGGNSWGTRELALRNNSTTGNIIIGGVATNFAWSNLTNAFGDPNLTCDEFGFEINGTNAIFYKNKVAVFTVPNLSKGTSRLEGALLFFGAQPSNDTAGSTSAISIVPNGMQYGDIEIFINDVLVRNYVMPSTGATVPDSVGGNILTQRGTWPANDSEWVFYSSGATAYSDTLLTGSYAHSGSLLNSSVGYSSALQAGAFTHSGSALSSVTARSSTLQAGSYSHSGSVLGSAAGYSSALQSGAFGYSGSELQSIIQNGAQNYSDTLLGGSFSHTGSALQSAIARNSTLLAGSYSHSGSILSASLAFYSTLNGGAYSHFGSMLQSTISGQVTVSIEGYTITFAADDVSGAFAADMVGGSYQSDYIEAIKWLI